MTANAKLREAIIVALSQPMSKRVSAVEALFQAHQQELLSGILGELPEKYRRLRSLVTGSDLVSLDYKARQAYTKSAQDNATLSNLEGRDGG